MATVSLSTVLLALVADGLTTPLHLNVAAAGDKQVKAGGVRPYASGRRRSISRVGLDRTVPLSIEIDERDQLEVLQGWQGQLVLYRDPRGRVVFGTYHELEVTENVTADLAVVTLTLTQVTYDEAV